MLLVSLSSVLLSDIKEICTLIVILSDSQYNLPESFSESNVLSKFIHIITVSLAPKLQSLSPPQYHPH